LINLFIGQKSACEANEFINLTAANSIGVHTIIEVIVIIPGSNCWSFDLELFDLHQSAAHRSRSAALVDEVIE
jgi:hypothetical protein